MGGSSENWDGKPRDGSEKNNTKHWRGVFQLLFYELSWVRELIKDEHKFYELLFA